MVEMTLRLGRQGDTCAVKNSLATKRPCNVPICFVMAQKPVFLLSNPLERLTTVMCFTDINTLLRYNPAVTDVIAASRREGGITIVEKLCDDVDFDTDNVDDENDDEDDDFDGDDNVGTAFAYLC